MTLKDPASREASREYVSFALRSLAVVVATLLLVISVANFFHVQVFRVSGASMEPTLRNNSLTAITTDPAREVQRGDIVLFEFPEAWQKHNTESANFVVKRVTALPGDSVRVTPEGVFVSGGSSYPHPSGYRCSPNIQFRVPQNTVFVMGDNPAQSFDSRFLACSGELDIAFVPLSDVKHKGVETLGSIGGYL